jgi:signal transduction histidine kinase/CheY-like chemotaxis protein
MQPGESADHQIQIDSDLAHRSLAGGFVYLGFVAALWAATDYSATHRSLLLAVGGISLVCACARFLLGYHFAQIHAWNARAWRSAFFLAVNLNILAWGLFLAATFLRFGYDNWKTMLLLICMAGTAPIALASLSPSLPMLRSFLCVLSVPMILANLYAGGARGYTMALVFSWYLLFAWVHAGMISRQYMEYIHEKFALASAKKAAESANLAKSAFLANMSHELRTPMNAILGMTHLAMSGPLEARQREYLSAVKGSGETLLQLLNGLLDFSKVEAGKVVLESIPFSVRDLVNETLQSFAIQIQEKSLALRSGVDHDVPLRVDGDPLRLRQVLINVVGNAVKFTSRGKIELRVSRLDQSNGIVTLHFTVRDTGIGIPAAKQRSIFEAFEQGDASTTREYGGTGLGLAISSKLVGLMSGRMWVESRPGEGSLFHWTARFANPTSEPVPHATLAENAWTTARAAVPLRILIAEDHEISRRLLKTLVEIRGHIATAVSNGNEALREIKQHEFDVVLMDIHMPEMDGLEATAAIRRNETGGRVPIIALTAESASGLREHYLAAGITEYLPKPVKPEALFALIESIGRRPGSAESEQPPLA